MSYEMDTEVGEGVTEAELVKWRLQSVGLSHLIVVAEVMIKQR